MKTEIAILEFLNKEVAEEGIHMNMDLANDMGLDGDDYFDLIEKYADEFDVDISEFLWYFHASEEGFSPIKWFIKPPNERVEHIAVTPELLCEFARIKKWGIQYPKHSLPSRRWDIILGQILGCILLLMMLYLYYLKLKL